MLGTLTASTCLEAKFDTKRRCPPGTSAISRGN
jgi:hypothetical protein